MPLSPPRDLTEADQQALIEALVDEAAPELDAARRHRLWAAAVDSEARPWALRPYAAACAELGLIDDSQDALAELREAETDLDVVARLDADELGEWEVEGAEVRSPAAGAIRLVGLGGQIHRVRHRLPPPRGAVVVCRGLISAHGGTGGTCRIELSAAGGSDAAVFDADSMWVRSSGFGASGSAGAMHFVELILDGQQTTLHRDGFVLARSRGLRATRAEEVVVGMFGTGSSDAEMVVRELEVLHAGSAAAALAPALPASVLCAVIEQLLHSGQPQAAIEQTVRARLALPDDPEVEAVLREVLTEGAYDVALHPLLAAARRALPLPDQTRLVPASVRLVVSADRVHVTYGRPRRRREQLVHALRGVSFSLYEGEMLGLLGRNGAGKSTLLALLADHLAPSEGSIIRNGRPMLLRQGVGFLPALTGRRNIYLSGLYLGLTRREIDERIEEIIDFAELRDAIDRPLRTFSTGMVSRLQFALATAVEPELLLLDELLGAGDASFTEKAQARMHALLRRAGAVVIASHDTHFIRSNCSKAIVLEHGEALYVGSPETAVAVYGELLEREPLRDTDTG